MTETAGRSAFAELREALRGTNADYTKIPLRRAVFLLAVPMVLELVLESTFAVIDIFFVGKLGPSAVATVGLTETMLFLLYAIAMGLAMAITAVVARRIGEGEREAEPAEGQVHAEDGRAGGVELLVVLLGVVLGDELHHRRAEAEVEDARVADEAGDERHDAVAVVAEPPHHEGRHQHADEQLRAEREPLGRDVSDEASEVHWGGARLRAWTYTRGCGER